MKCTRHPLVVLALWLVSAYGIFQAPPVAALCGGAHGPPQYPRVQPECWEDYNQLIEELTRPTRRSHTMRIVQSRNGLPAPMAVHTQYGAACFFFAVAPILEYLGYSRFEHGSHYVQRLWYKVRDHEYLEFHDLDVGYHGSPEDLIVRHYIAEVVDRTLFGSEGAEIYPCGFFAGDTCNLAVDPRLTINTTGVLCHDPVNIINYHIFEPGQEYGMCQTLLPTAGASADSYPAFLNAAVAGCDNATCACAGNATCGAYYFLNKRSNGAGGCRDALNFDARVATSAEKNALRRIIKGFIDNNTPLLAGVNSGDHWIPIVGYADMDRQGLPETAITADSVQRVYWLVDLRVGMRPDVWNRPERYSIRGISPWNHNLDRACEERGWARRLDRVIRSTYSQAIANKYQLCGTAQTRLACEDDRYYGAELLCERDSDGNRAIDQRTRYFVNEDDLFVSDHRTISCDKLRLRWRDGSRRVTHARAYRFSLDAASGRWTQLSSYAPDTAPVVESTPPPGRTGPETQVVWDRQWTDGRTLVGDGISASSPKRRTTLYLRFDNGDVRTIEISPPGTYGVDISCFRETPGTSAGAGSARYSVHRFFHKEPVRDLFLADQPDYKYMTTIPVPSNTTCDALAVQVKLGTNHQIASAEVERFYYGAAGVWRSARGVWHPNLSQDRDEGLSGGTKYFFWGRSWENQHWLAAHNVGEGAGYGDRKTVIRLKNRAGATVRVIEPVPQVGQQPPSVH